MLVPPRVVVTGCLCTHGILTLHAVAAVVSVYRATGRLARDPML